MSSAFTFDRIAESKRQWIRREGEAIKGDIRCDDTPDLDIEWELQGDLVKQPVQAFRSFASNGASLESTFVAQVVTPAPALRG
ncbi:hypothetical protein AAE478_002914 [Parahypoxylon ruwenzoriense]